MQLSYERARSILRQFPHRHHSLGILSVGRKRRWSIFVAQSISHKFGGALRRCRPRERTSEIAAVAAQQNPSHGTAR